jgi:hypothetical protein
VHTSASCHSRAVRGMTPWKRRQCRQRKRVPSSRTSILRCSAALCLIRLHGLVLVSTSIERRMPIFTHIVSSEANGGFVADLRREILYPPSCLVTNSNQVQCNLEPD